MKKHKAETVCADRLPGTDRPALMRQVENKEEFDMKKRKTVWCFLDGKKHCDVVKWGLAANVDVTEAKKLLTAQYPDLTVTFKVM